MGLQELISDLVIAKLNEEEAKENRIAIEEEIAKLVPGPEIGQKTVNIEGFKVTVKRGFNYKANLEEIDKLNIWNDNPIPVSSKTTRLLDEKGYEWYRNNNKNIFDKISKFVSVTPKKVSITLEEPKQ